MPTSTAHTEVPGGHGAFPPFERDTFASQLVWLSVSFVLLYVLMAKVALPRIGLILEARSERIANDLKMAERLKDQSDAAQAANVMQLNDARIRAAEIVNTTRALQSAEAENLRKKLDAQFEQKMKEAENSIAKARTAAMANVQTIAADATCAIMERLVGRAPAKKELVAAVVEAAKNLGCYRARG